MYVQATAQFAAHRFSLAAVADPAAVFPPGRAVASLPQGVDLLLAMPPELFDALAGPGRHVPLADAPWRTADTNARGGGSGGGRGTTVKPPWVCLPGQGQPATLLIEDDQFPVPVAYDQVRKAGSRGQGYHWRTTR